MAQEQHHLGSGRPPITKAFLATFRIDEHVIGQGGYVERHATSLSRITTAKSESRSPRVIPGTLGPPLESIRPVVLCLSPSARACMPDYKQGIKKDVSEIKFLIHDLRVERFIDEVIHFHVGLDTDLQLYGIVDPLVITGDDLRKLRTLAVSLRLAFESYSESVKGFAAPETVLSVANEYVRSIHDLCELILHPMWSHIDAALTVLPDVSRSVRSRSHYRNVVRWLCGSTTGSNTSGPNSVRRSTRSSIWVPMSRTTFVMWCTAGSPSRALPGWKSATRPSRPGRAGWKPAPFSAHVLQPDHERGRCHAGEEGGRASHRKRARRWARQPFGPGRRCRDDVRANPPVAHRQGISRW